MSTDQAAPQSATRPPAGAKVVRYHDYIAEKIEGTRRMVKLVDLATALVELAVAVLLFLAMAVVVEHWVVPGGFSVAIRFVLFAVLAVGCGYFIVRRLWPLVSLAINPVYAAQTIEHGAPTLKNSLINLLLLRQKRSEVSDAVYQTLEEQAARGLTRVSVETAVDRTQLIHLGYVLVAVVAVAASYKVLSPKDPFIAAERLLLPWADIVPASRVTIQEIVPGHVTISRGESIDVSADIRGLAPDELAVLRFSTEDGQIVGRAMPLRRSADGLRYECRLAEEGPTHASVGVTRNLTYRLEAGDARSLTYKVTALPAPSILVERVEFDYPDYTGYLDRTVEQLGDVRGIEGTRVTVHARANGEVREAHVDFDADGRRDLRMSATDSDASATFELALREDRQTPLHASYVLRFTNSEGRQNRNPVKYAIEVDPDLPPEVEIRQPLEPVIDVPLDGSALIELGASDPDFALAAVRLRGLVGQRECVNVSLLETEHRGRFHRKFELKPRAHGLKVGNVLTYWVEAQDNRAPQANTVATEHKSLRIIGGKGETKQEDAKQEDAKQEDSKQEDSKQEDSKQEDSKQEDSKQEGSKQEGSKQEGSKQEDSKQEDSKQEDSKQEDSKQEDSKQEGAGEQPAEKKSDAGGERHESAGDEKNKEGEKQSAAGEGQQDAGEEQQATSEGQQAGAEGQSAKGEGTADGAKSESTSAESRPKESESASTPGDQSSSPSAKPSTGETHNNNQPGQPAGGQQSPVSAEGDDDAEAFNRIQEHMQQQGDLPREAQQNKQDQQPSGHDAQEQEPFSRDAERSAAPPTKEQSTSTSAEAKQAPNDEQTNTEGTPGQGGEQQSQGTPDSQPGKKPTEKPQQSPSKGEKGNVEEPPSPSDSRRESDSHGEEGGSKAGGGEEGGGQKSARDGTGSEGQNQSADNGGGQSHEKGRGENSSEAGRDAVADHPTGETTSSPNTAKQHPSGRDAQDQSASSRDTERSAQSPSEKPTSTSQPNEKTSEPGEQSQHPSGRDAKNQQPFSRDAERSAQPPNNTQTTNGLSANGEPGGAVNPQPGASGDAPPGDAANMEYARKQTDLVLGKLADQLREKKVDDKLLKELGWSEDDLRRFVARWQHRKAAAEQGDAASAGAKREWEDALRSLGLRPGELRQDILKDDTMRDLSEGYRGQVPAEYKERLRAYNRGVSRARQQDE